MTKADRPLKKFQVNVISLGVATIEAPTKAEAARRARKRDYDSYELRKPEPTITSLAEGKPVTPVLVPVEAPVVFRSDGAP